MIELPADLVTGVDDIDREHTHLFALVRKLTRICGHHEGVRCEECPSDPVLCREAVCDDLDHMTVTIKAHFANEEKHFGCLEERDAQLHRDDHADIAASLVDFRKAAELQLIELNPRSLKLALTDYLEHHLVNHDLKLAARLNTCSL